MPLRTVDFEPTAYAIPPDRRPERIVPQGSGSLCRMAVRATCSATSWKPTKNHPSIPTATERGRWPIGIRTPKGDPSRRTSREAERRNSARRSLGRHRNAASEMQNGTTTMNRGQPGRSIPTGSKGRKARAEGGCCNYQRPRRRTDATDRRTLRRQDRRVSMLRGRMGPDCCRVRNGPPKRDGVDSGSVAAGSSTDPAP